MSEPKGRLGEILIAAGKLDREQLEAGLERQRESGQPLGMTLGRMGALDEESLIRTLAVQLSLPMARLRGKRVVQEVIELVPFELAEKHHCFPLFVKEEGDGQVLYLGMEDATNLDALDEMSSRLGIKVRPVLVATSEIDDALSRHYQAGPAAGEAEPCEALPAGEPGSEPADTEDGGPAELAPESEPSGRPMSDSDFEMATPDQDEAAPIAEAGPGSTHGETT